MFGEISIFKKIIFLKMKKKKKTCTNNFYFWIPKRNIIRLSSILVVMILLQFPVKFRVIFIEYTEVSEYEKLLL